MRFRKNCVIVLCVAVISTPALPQNNPSNLTLSPQNVSSSTAVPASLRSALRAWGLERVSSGRSFTRKKVSANVVEFENLTLNTPDSGSLTIGKMIITRDNVRGPTFGQISIQAEAITRTDGVRVTNVSMTGISGVASPISLLNIILGSATVQNSDAASFKAQIANVELSGFSNSSGFSVEGATFESVVLGRTIEGVSAISLKDVSIEDNTSIMRMNRVALTGVGNRFWSTFNTGNARSTALSAFSSLALGGVTIDGLSIKAAPNITKPLPFSTLLLGNFTLVGVTDGNIDQFTLSNFALTGGEGPKAWQGTFERLGVSAINTRYMAVLGDIFRSSLGALAHQQNQTVTQSTPPELKLKDVLKGGPLDGGFSALDFSNFNLASAGMSFGIDQIKFAQRRDNAGIVIAAQLEPMQMRLSGSPPAVGPRTPTLSGMLASLAAQGFVLKLSGLTTFSPQTDLLKLETYQMELVDWGRISMNFEMLGFNEFMSETTFGELIRVSADAAKPNAGASAQQLREFLAFYRNISLKSARFAVEDLGGIDKATRLVISQRPGGEGGTATAAQLAQTRESWASPLRAAAGDKKKPVIERMFTIAAARSLETGDSMVIDIKPPAPVAIASLQTFPTDPVAQFGVRIFSQPAVPR
jgi:hypothetical protein